MASRPSASRRYQILGRDFEVCPWHRFGGMGVPYGATMGGSAYYITFAELRGVLGEDGARKLVSLYGGQRVYVRERFPDAHPVVEALGADLAATLASHVATGVGGMSVEIPTGGSENFAEYRRRLREAASDLRRTEAQVASDLGVHARTVRRMRAQLRAERNQEMRSHRGLTGHLSGA